MNYIAHIHLAHQTNTSMVGNFLGDFIKGSDLSNLHPEIRQGVLLHRKIDSFTDSHELTAEMRSAFPNQIRRMSGVIMDVYFDHLLCKFWGKFNHLNLEDMLEEFYIQLSQTNVRTPRFSRVQESLVKNKWLANYQHVEGYQNALVHIQTRLNNKIQFAAAAMDFINKNEETLQAMFIDFYPIVIEYAKSLVNENNV
ncbi:MAG: ACP phosphodiesterase [Pseudomonadota bacterium]